MSLTSKGMSVVDTFGDVMLDTMRREIAARLSVPEGTVKTWMFRARRTLRQRLQKENFLLRRQVSHLDEDSGIIGSCDQGLRTEGASAVGISSDDFKFVVDDVLEEVDETHDDDVLSLGDDDDDLIMAFCDVETDGDQVVVYTEAADFMRVRTALAEAGLDGSHR